MKGLRTISSPLPAPVDYAPKPREATKPQLNYETNFEPKVKGEGGQKPPEENFDVQIQQDNPQKESVPEYEFLSHDLDFFKLAKVFSLNVNDLHLFQDKLQRIHKWAKENSEGTTEDILLKVKQMQREMGFTGDEKMIDQVYRWVVLDEDSKRIEKEKKLLK